LVRVEAEGESAHCKAHGVSLGIRWNAEGLVPDEGGLFDQHEDGFRRMLLEDGGAAASPVVDLARCKAAGLADPGAGEPSGELGMQKGVHAGIL
jgi:hypothetical protein